MKLAASILLIFFVVNFASANSDSTTQPYIIGTYKRVVERDEYQQHLDSVRGVWGGGYSPFSPICTFGAPEEIRVPEELLLLMPDGEINSRVKGGPFSDTARLAGTWQQNGDTILMALGGQKKKYLIEGKKLLDLSIMLNIDSSGRKDIYYQAFKHKYYLRVAE